MAAGLLHQRSASHHLSHRRNQHHQRLREVDGAGVSVADGSGMGEGVAGRRQCRPLSVGGRGTSVSFSNANYRGSTIQFYDTAGTNTFNPLFEMGDFPYTGPVGSFAASAYGLSDMAGNVMEWCWDGYDENWYSTTNAT